VLRSALIEKGVPALPSSMMLSSDPAHELEPANAGDIFISKIEEKHGPVYLMTQPAIVVLDVDGKVVTECSWSWKTMGYANGKEMDIVPPHGIPLVATRPDIFDLATAIKERRPPKMVDLMYVFKN